MKFSSKMSACLLFFWTGYFSLIDLVFAAEGTDSKLFGVAKEFGTNIDVIKKSNVWENLGIFLNYVLTVIGLISLLMFLYGGAIILTSQGNDEKVAEARKIITYAILGVVIISLAYALNSWIFGSSFFQTSS